MVPILANPKLILLKFLFPSKTRDKFGRRLLGALLGSVVPDRQMESALTRITVTLIF